VTTGAVAPDIVRRVTVFLALLLPLAAAPIPASSFDQVKAAPNPERRARAAVEFAVTAERNALSNGDKKSCRGIDDHAREHGNDAGLSDREQEDAGTDLGPYKYAEIRSRELLIRLDDLERRLLVEDRELVAVPKARVLEIHDYWFERIMSRRK
jgi:hypothetical protein